MENLRNAAPLANGRTDDVDGLREWKRRMSNDQPQFKSDQIPAEPAERDYWSAEGGVTRDGSRCEITIAADLAEYMPTPAEMRDFLQNIAGHYELGWTWKKVRTLEAAREQARALINSTQAVLNDIEDSILGAQAAYELLAEELKAETTVE